jgi:P pilus assembly chaperone PapD
MDSIMKIILVNMVSIINGESQYIIRVTKKGQDAPQTDPEQLFRVEDLVFLQTDEHV